MISLPYKCRRKNILWKKISWAAKDVSPKLSWKKDFYLTVIQNNKRWFFVGKRNHTWLMVWRTLYYNGFKRQTLPSSHFKHATGKYISGVWLVLFCSFMRISKEEALWAICFGFWGRTADIQTKATGLANVPYGGKIERNTSSTILSYYRPSLLLLKTR